ncbi:MAG TPA: DUF4157 domain-containing protein [Kofleriaceae bacterium]|jgi:hypothetical protein|nr:DUF4157 domain-containing protein [Kofleriaceae bacterium]
MTTNRAAPVAKPEQAPSLAPPAHAHAPAAPAKRTRDRRAPGDDTVRWLLGGADATPHRPPIDAGYGDIVAAARAPMPPPGAQLQHSGTRCEDEEQRQLPTDPAAPAAVQHRPAAPGAAPAPPRGPGFLGVASAGVQHASAPLPHLERIQRAFGAHSISHVRAVVGGAGATAAAHMDAEAYATGDRVAFRGAPDVHLAAHEAAHVVQQRAGVHLEDGVGRPGDPYERQADAVADAVVQGRSAEHLLPSTGGAPRVAVQHQTKVSHQVYPDGSEQLMVWMEFRGEILVFALSPDSATLARFTADPGLLDQLGAALTDALEPGGIPVAETKGFLTGPRVREIVEAALPRWVDAPGSKLTRLVELLAVRAGEFRKQRVRVELEAYLGVDPGTIDWRAALPGLQSDFDARGDDSLQAGALRDRADLVLRVLDAELAATPTVAGGTSPPGLSDAVWNFAMSFNLAPGTLPQAFSEKYLGEYVQQIAQLQFVPAGFDLARYRPGTSDLAADRRHQLIDQWVAANATEATTRIVLDDWVQSRLDFEVYIAHMDVDAKKALVLDQLTDAFLAAAKTDRELDAALHRMADAQATYAILARLVAAGRTMEQRNAALVAAIADPDPQKHPELAGLAADPRAVFEAEYYMAQAIHGVLSHVEQGARVDAELVRNAVAISGQASISPDLGLAAFLLAIGTELRALAAVRDTQRGHARDDIAERVELSWPKIKAIIERRGQEADRFIDGTWIPMLKRVAGEWVDANYREIQNAHDHFARWAPQTSARYRLTAWLIDDIANKLASGEIESSSLGGATVTRANIKDLRTAAATLRAQAADLDSPKGRSNKRHELNQAIAAYAKVKANIADGTYKPQNYGEEVVVEAKRRLHIGVFEHSSLWQQATRQVTVRDNPFQAYTIAMWRVENLIDDAVSNLLTGLLRGALTLGSLLVPGVGGLILAAIDIGLGVYSAAQNIGEARRRLDLARLDTQLNIQGVTVEDARHALNMAWVSLVIELAMAGLFVTLGAKLAAKGIQNWRMPNLAKLAQTDAALAAKLVQQVGDAKLVDTLLGHFAGDGQKLVEALAYVKDGKSLAALLARVRDAELLAGLLRSAGSDVALLGLLDKFKDLKRLDALLGVASPRQLLRLLELARDEAAVARVLRDMKPEAAIEMLAAQAEARAANVELIRRLKAANPALTNKEIADLAAKSLRVPKVPFGYTAPAFQRAQQVIKDALAREGITNAEGFTTGSRVTGTTMNPQKGARFGQLIEDFSGRDLDITLITDKQIGSAAQHRIESAFKAEFGHDLGIRNIVDRRQLDYIPMYGKIDLAL